MCSRAWTKIEGFPVHFTKLAYHMCQSASQQETDVMLTWSHVKRVQKTCGKGVEVPMGMSSCYQPSAWKGRGEGNDQNRVKGLTGAVIFAPGTQAASLDLAGKAAERVDALTSFSFHPPISFLGSTLTKPNWKPSVNGAHWCSSCESAKDREQVRPGGGGSGMPPRSGLAHHDTTMPWCQDQQRTAQRTQVQNNLTYKNRCKNWNKVSANQFQILIMILLVNNALVLNWVFFQFPIYFLGFLFLFLHVSRKIPTSYSLLLKGGEMP